MHMSLLTKTWHGSAKNIAPPPLPVWSVPADPRAKRTEMSVCCFTCTTAGEPGRGRAHAARRAGRRRTHAALGRSARRTHGLLLWALLRPRLRAQRRLLLLLRRRRLLWLLLLLLLLLLLVGVHLRHMRRGAAPNNCQRHQHVLWVSCTGRWPAASELDPCPGARAAFRDGCPRTCELGGSAWVPVALARSARPP